MLDQLVSNEETHLLGFKAAFLFFKKRHRLVLQSSVLIQGVPQGLRVPGELEVRQELVELRSVASGPPELFFPPLFFSFFWLFFWGLPVLCWHARVQGSHGHGEGGYCFSTMRETWLSVYHGNLPISRLVTSFALWESKNSPGNQANVPFRAYESSANPT